MINENTIIKLKKQYKKAEEYLNEYFNNKPQMKDEFFENFHIRPTSSSHRIVCMNECFRVAMRTCEARNKAAFIDGIEKAFCLIKDLSAVQSMPKQEVFDKYKFNVYECGKRNKQTEYVIQAKFAKHIKSLGYSLLATEFNIKSGGRQRVDIVAYKNGELWLIEIKDGDIKTNATEQVNAYRELISQNKNICWELLSCIDHFLPKNFTVKTAVVYTKGEKQRVDIDKLWKYENESFVEQ